MTFSGENHIIEHIEKATISKTFTVDADGALHYLLIARDAEVKITINHAGKKSSSRINCIFLSKDGIKVAADIKSSLDADEAGSNIYLLSLLGNKADCHVDGGVVISPNITKASGHLLEENVILGKKVKIKTLPMLDVRSSDVSASHGAKIDRLDQGKLFYMMTRGLDEQASQRLIVQGYITRLCEEM